MTFKKFAAFVVILLTHITASSQDFGKYISSSDLFFDQISKAEQSKAMPRLTDEKAAPLIATLSDSQTFLDPYTFKVNDLNVLMEVCGRANKIVMSYILFNLKNQVDPKAQAAGVTNGMVKLMEKNVYAFQPELQRLQPFLIRCMAKQLRPVTEFTKGLKKEELTEVRISGLRKMRTGTFSAYFGLVQATSDPKVGESYKIALLKVLAEDAGIYQSIMQPPARQKIVEHVKAALPTAPKSFVEYLEKIGAAMANTSCEDLCAID